MQPMASCPAPACWWLTGASGLLLHWQLQFGRYSVFYLFIFLLVMLPSEIISHRPTCDRVSYCLETSPPAWLPPQDGSPSLTLLFHFCLLYFVLPPFEENGLPFWVPGVFRSCFVEVAQHSSNLLMNLWWRKWSPHPIPLPSWEHPSYFLKLMFILSSDKCTGVDLFGNFIFNF